MNEREIQRLGKICALLTSNHDGERAAAALLASQIIAEAGIAWPEVIAAAFDKLGECQPKHDPGPVDTRLPGWHVMYCEVIIEGCFGELNEWERGFVRSLLSNFESRLLSSKQEYYLGAIAKKCGLNLPKAGGAS